MIHACTTCNDTGSMSKSLDGYLDCGRCDVASARAALNEWAARTNVVGTSLWWMIYQHGKAAAIPPCYRLVPVDPAAPCKS